MEALVLVPVLIGSIVIHEVAHAWQARREGDDTAERLGRITLNPIPHLDPVGSFLVPLGLWFWGGGLLFGWAKPVPVNPEKYREYVAGDIRVSLAGIVSNLVLALVSMIALGVVTKVGYELGPLGGVTDVLGLACWYGVFLNLILAFFNLLPIPPLDGSHVVAHLLPRAWQRGYRRLAPFGILALLAVSAFYPGAFSLLLWPVMELQGFVDWFARLWI